MRTIASCFYFLLSATWAFAQASQPAAPHTITINKGDLWVVFRDNSESPGILSGVESLINMRDAEDFNAFDPDTRGAAAGLNFEHIISNHKDPHNAFSPRQGKYELTRGPGDAAVRLTRRHEDDPWAMDSTMTYSVTSPHYIDMEFRCKAHDAKRFGKNGWAILFWGTYMNDVAETPFFFRGLKHTGSKEEWIPADAPPGPKDWDQGGTYRNVNSRELAYDADHNFKLNNWSYEQPRYTLPFYYGKCAHDMVYIIMFDRDYSAIDEIRFSIFKFKLKRFPRPAWDFEYVIHRVEENKEFGYRARVVWKKFVSDEDCLHEYEKWASSLKR